MLNELTGEQEKLMDDVATEWIQDANGGQTHIDQRIAADSLKKIYVLAELKEPGIVFLDGPMDAAEFCEKELKTKIETFDWFGIGYDAGWVSFYDYFQKIGELERDDVEFNAVRDFMKSGVWATVLFENLAICISRPCLVKTDEQGNLHAEDGPAIAFNDGYAEFAWHGTWVTEKIILTPEKLTQEEIIGEKNSEVARAIAERLGWDEYLKRVEAVLVDKWFDPEKKLHYELYDFKDRKFSLMPRLLKMESPELNDGTRPHYIEPVDHRLKTCQAARRWQFADEKKILNGKTGDAIFPTVDECNSSPEITFEVEA